MNIEEPSEEELFNDAVSDETPDDPVVTEQTEQPERNEPVRDEAGRFAAKEEPAEEVVAEQVEKPAVDDNAPMVPSWRVREINDEKRALAERLAAAEARLAQPAPQTVQPPAKVEKPDPLLDPEGYEQYLERRFDERLLNDRRETSLQNAARAYKEEFTEAYTAAQKNIDPALRSMMQQSNDPGETLIQWYRGEKTRQEVGNDLTAYKQRLRDEFLKDPEFLAKAQEAARTIAQPQANGRPRVELPPSMSGASRSNALLKSGGNEDVSDSELFQQIAG
jgi:hypothetical protein